MRKASLTFLTALALFAPMTVAADVLVMNNGQKLEGRAEEIDHKPEKVRFTRGVGSMEIARSSINEIIEEPDSVDYRRIGLQLVEAKSYKRAIELFDMSLALDPEETAATEGRARAQAAIEQADLEAGRESALKVEVDIEASRRLVAEERFEEAEALLQRVAATSTTEAQRTAAQLALIELHTAWGFQRLDRLDPKGAELHYSRVLEMDPQNSDARERLLEVWKDDPARREDVLKAYTIKLQSDPDNLELNAKVADSFLMLNRYEDALPMLEKLAVSPSLQGPTL
jgi:tetratricopeptide (TPR) repeat protein